MKAILQGMGVQFHFDSQVTAIAPQGAQVGLHIDGNVLMADAVVCAAGSAIAARALGRLGHLLGESRYLDAAAHAVQGAAGKFQEHPLGFCGLLTALEEQLTPPQTLILRGEAGALGPWLTAARAGYQPLRLTLAIPPEAADLPGVLAHCRPQGDAVAYLCQGGHCSAPITTLGGLTTALASHA